MSEDITPTPTPTPTTPFALEPAPTSAPPPPLPGINQGGIRELIKSAADKLETLEWDEDDKEAQEAADDAVDDVITAARKFGENEVVIPKGCKAGWNAATGEVIFECPDGSEKRVRASIIHVECPLCRAPGKEVRVMAGKENGGGVRRLNLGTFDQVKFFTGTVGMGDIRRVQMDLDTKEPSLL